MRYFKFLHALARNEEGAVTVDWVVLTAAIAGLGMAVVAILWSEIGTANNKISIFMESQTVKSTF